MSAWRQDCGDRRVNTLKAAAVHKEVPFVQPSGRFATCDGKVFTRKHVPSRISSRAAAGRRSARQTQATIAPACARAVDWPQKICGTVATSVQKPRNRTRLGAAFPGSRSPAPLGPCPRSPTCSCVGAVESYPPDSTRSPPAPEWNTIQDAYFVDIDEGPEFVE